MKNKEKIKNEAREEYYQLRNDDKDFAEQWRDNKKDFEEWFKDVYLPSIEGSKLRTYKIFPNFAFDIEAENEIKAQEKATEILNEMKKVKCFDYDFDIEDEGKI